MMTDFERLLAEAANEYQTFDQLPTHEYFRLAGSFLEQDSPIDCISEGDDSQIEKFQKTLARMVNSKGITQNSYVDARNRFIQAVEAMVEGYARKHIEREFDALRADDEPPVDDRWKYEGLTVTRIDDKFKEIVEDTTASYVKLLGGSNG